MKDFINANKCIQGETYFLTGIWYDYDFVNFKHKPLINTPVKFIGKNKSVKKSRSWFGSNGQFVFKIDGGKIINVTGDSSFLLSKIDNPEILN